MSNETKRDVFEKMKWELISNLANTIYQNGGLRPLEDATKVGENYATRYDAALPDDLPTILECVSKEIKAGYGNYSLLDELAWANQDALPSSKVSEWINDNESLFAEAWSRGLWIVEETGEVTSYDD